MFDPLHIHTITDPGHSHTIDEPNEGHQHTYYYGGGGSGTPYSDEGRPGTSNNYSTETATQIANVLIGSATTGITGGNTSYANNLSFTTVTMGGGQPYMPLYYVLAFIMRIS
jgi:hypothetical protein